METDSSYDVAVIGGGPGGTPAAMHLAAMGKKVLLVESSGKLGGACLFSGCIPSKIIRHAASDYHQAKGLFAGQGKSPGGPTDAWDRAMKKMDQILPGRSSAAGLKAAGMKSLDLVAGMARFLSPREIEVKTQDGVESRYAFDKAIVATGSVPVTPPIGGDGIKKALTSESFFSRRELPSSIVIIGGGPIGVEMGQMLARMKVSSTIIEMAGSILDKVCEPEFTPRIQEALKRDDVDIFTSALVDKVNRNEDGFVTTFTDADGHIRTIPSAQVLLAAGRAPNIESLDLDRAGIHVAPGGIEVNQYLETSVEGIYATGDVIEGPRFAHTATYEALVAAVNIASGNHRTVDFSINSWVLFTDPEMASAGLTEAQAVEGGREVITGAYDFAIDAAAQVEGSPVGQLRFVVDKVSREIVGVHILARHAGSLAGEAALIVAKKLTLSDVSQAIHPHPTWNESFGLLAVNMLASLG